MIDPLSSWKSSLAALAKVTDDSWAANFAAWYGDRIAAISPDPSQLVATGFSFTFEASTFASQLLDLTPVDHAAGFATAWESAMMASSALCLPGTFKPPTSPLTLFSAVTSTVIDPASIAAGKTILGALATAPAVVDPADSTFPATFRDATLALTISVAGLDSQPPPSAGPGPQALTVAGVALL